jgi:hypothetical protein
MSKTNETHSNSITLQNFRKIVIIKLPASVVVGLEMEKKQEAELYGVHGSGKLKRHSPVTSDA